MAKKSKTSRTPPAKVATVIIVPVEEVGWLRRLGDRVAAFYAGPQQSVEMTPISATEIQAAFRKIKRKPKRATRKP